MTDTVTKTPSLDEILNQEVRATGQDIPAGTYGATLFGFTEPAMVKTLEKFRKPGHPDARLMFDARFGTYTADGQLAELTYFLPVPDGGTANRKSNLHKMLKALAAGNRELMDEAGNIPKGIKLISFYGRNAVLNVERNTQDWPQVKSVVAAIAGIKYPTVAECLDQLKGSKDVPF